jgi:glycogen synthase
MNVLFLIHRYPASGLAVGGSERFVQEIAGRLVAEGHRATVYTSDIQAMEGFWRRGSDRLADGVNRGRDGVEVHRFKARVLPGHGAICRLLDLVPWSPVGLTMAPPGLVLPGLWQAVRAAAGFDLVHASAYPSLIYLGAVAARRSGARLVAMPCTHAGSAGPRRYFLGRRMVDLYRQAAIAIALTDGERQLLVTAGVAPERVYVTGAGVDPQAAAGADGLRFRQRHDLPVDAPIVAFIGHKTPGKGVLHLLAAARQLLTGRPELIMAMVGETTPEFTGCYQALPQPVRDHVLSLRLSEAEKHDLLAACSLLALPSQDDSFGIVLLEAWLHGRPVVGARAGGIPEVIADSHSGLLVPFGDPTALADAITSLLDHPDRAAQMGAAGRAATLQRWTWDAVYRRVVTAYEHGLAA